MTVQQAIRERRSVRKYSDRRISPEQLISLVELGIWAPSGGNAQTWRFIVVTDAASIRVLHAVSPGMLTIPPAVIAVCQDLETAFHKGGALGRDRCALMDAAMAAQNVMLAAHAEGLGTCSIASFHADAVADALALPEGVTPVLLLSIGEPAAVPEAPQRAVKDVIFLNRYGVTDASEAG